MHFSQRRVSVGLAPASLSENLVSSQASQSVWGFGRQSGTETRFFPRNLTFFCQYHSATNVVHFQQFRTSLNSALHFVHTLLFTLQSSTPNNVNS